MELFLAKKNQIEWNGIESENKAKSNMQSAEKGARDALQLISHELRFEFQRNRTTTVLICQTIKTTCNYLRFTWLFICFLFATFLTIISHLKRLNFVFGLVLPQLPLLIYLTLFLPHAVIDFQRRIHGAYD